MESLDNNWPSEFGLPSEISVQHLSHSIIRSGKLANQASSKLFHPTKGTVSFDFSRHWFSVFRGFFEHHLVTGSRPAMIYLNLDGTSKKYFMYMNQGFIANPDMSFERWTVSAKIFLEEIV